MSLISSIWDEIKNDLRDRFWDAYGSVLDSVRRYLAGEIKNWPQYFVPGTSVYDAVVKYCDIFVKHLTPNSDKTPTT